MRGQLEVFPVAELLRFGLRDDRSGTIEVRCGRARGRIVFSHGWVLEASSPAVANIAPNHDTVTHAVAELMTWRSGDFTVEVESPDFARTITIEIELSRLVRDALIRDGGEGSWYTPETPDART